MRASTAADRGRSWPGAIRRFYFIERARGRESSAMTPQEISAAPTISLGGLNYPIPKLAPRQRIVVPKGLALMKVIAETAGTAQAGEITAEQFEDLIEIVWMACTRAEPSLKREEFLDRPATFFDLMSALSVIMVQTGMAVMPPAEPEPAAIVAAPPAAEPAAGG